jgi:pyrimidine operon attenuation protein/uracil phosphoribosyltransferase
MKVENLSHISSLTLYICMTIPIHMNVILNHQEIQQKINRLAFEIIENTFEEPAIYLGGICGNGILLAKELQQIICTSSEIKAEVFEISIDKEAPWSKPISLDIEEQKLKNAYIIMVDDVLNSGKTMQYALVKLLQRPTKTIKTVVLVERMHRRYPIKADFTGIALSTTLKERVEVELNAAQSKAYLH